MTDTYTPTVSSWRWNLRKHRFVRIASPVVAHVGALALGGVLGYCACMWRG
jgi:hypothetical protein